MSSSICWILLVVEESHLVSSVTMPKASRSSITRHTSKENVLEQNRRETPLSDVKLGLRVQGVERLMLALPDSAGTIKLACLRE